MREILGSFRWHLSSKGGHPAASPPVWDWFINRKAFPPFHYDPPNVFAQTDPFLLLSMVIFIFALPPWLYRRRGEATGSLRGFLEYRGVLHTSVRPRRDDAVQLLRDGSRSPPAAIVMGVALKELLRWEAFIESLWVYWEFLLGAKDWLLRRLKISR